MTEDKDKNLKTRPPIVVVMGHVDHGKTKLLDYIKKTNIAEKEAGGITQSIGAYEIVHNGKKITFVDTPGHEAFFKMREHGAKIADLAILVVAADEGVKPQTKEALKCILDEEMPYVVAVNKIDKRNADIESVKEKLKEAGVLLEGEGGNVSWQAISAKTGEGIDELLDFLLLAAEVENLTHNPQGPARGVILTAHLDSRRGVLVGGIVIDGVLRKGEEVFTATARGKIKILEDFHGRQVESLEPSAPVMILGFETAPEVGEEFSTDTELINKSESPLKKETRAVGQEVQEDLATKVILKADESGSLDALLHIIGKISKETNLKVVDKSIGNIHESDVKLASSVGAIIIGFKIKKDKAAENTAKMQNIMILTSDIIYELEKNLEDYLKKDITKESAVLEVLAVFSGLKQRRQVVGGRVTSGVVKNQEEFEVWEGENLVGSGKIVNLQREKRDVAEIQEGKEAGLLVETDSEIKVGHHLRFIKK